MNTKQEHAMQLAALLASEAGHKAAECARALESESVAKSHFHGAQTQALIDASKAASPAPYMVARDALALLRIGAGVARRAVAYCNGEGHRVWGFRHGEGGYSPPGWAWDENDDARKERADEKALAKATEIAARYGATVKIGGDPRGFTMRLFLASGRSNGFTGDGWGIA